MKVSTPSVSWHNRERISSLDFQRSPWPNEKYVRLASGGDDKHVVIWDCRDSLACIADLSRHQNSVNAVRWSKDGKVLASGDTDSAIYLWHYQDIPCAPDLFGDELMEDDSSGETWSVWKILRGHLQDVVSLDWSSCGTYIISSSTDNTAIIFDVHKGTKLKILSEHKGWVNGVGFDPLGKFVASICSDRYLRVYNTKSYKTVSKTNKCKLLIPSEGGKAEEKGVRLFHDDTFQSFYRRLDFSPDGELLVVPSGVLEIEQEASISHCTYVFSRTNFAKPVLYLPHKEFSVAVRFCPLLFELRPIPNPDAPKSEASEEELKPWEKFKTIFALPYRMIYAVATQNTVMFYDTQQSTPFARVSKIHYIGLTDLSWSADGHSCIVSSTDGYASFIEFQKGELGKTYCPPPPKKNGLEEISINVPTKTVKGEPKSSLSTKDNLHTNITKEAVKDSASSVPTLPAKKSCTDKTAVAKTAAGFSSSSQDKAVNVIAFRKTPNGDNPTAPKDKKVNVIAARKAPKEPEVSIIATKKAPSSSNNVQQSASNLPKPVFEEPATTPVSSGISLPTKSPKRVQLVTLASPKDVEMEEEEEEESDLGLFLEDESPIQKS